MTNHFERLNQAFAKHYRILRVIGRNGWTIYLAEDLSRHCEVELWVTVPNSPVGAACFLRETTLIAQLDPRISGGRPYPCPGPTRPQGSWAFQSGRLNT